MTTPISLGKLTDLPISSLFGDLGEQVALCLPGGQSLTQLGMAVKWDPKADSGKAKGFASLVRKASQALGRKKTGTPADLDAVAVALDARGQAAGISYFANLRSLEGGMWHTGDSQDGAADGWDETVTVDLTAPMMRRVKTIVFLLTAYKPGTSLGSVDNVIFGVLNGPDKTSPLVGEMFPVTVDSRNNGIVMARLVQVGGVWYGEAINAGVSFDNRSQDEKAALCAAAAGYAVRG